MEDINRNSHGEFTRKQFLLGALGATGSLMLAACAPKANGKMSDTGTATDATDVPADEIVEADFVVIGSGMAGHVAAIQAAQAGCKRVVMLEKNSSVGGSTLFAEGIFGNGDRYALDLGYGPYDLTEVLAEEVQWSHGIIDQQLFMNYMKDSTDYINWMMDLGVEFDHIENCGTERYFLHMYKGGNGTSAIEALNAAAVDDYGIDVRTDTRATSLLMEGDAVVGVRASSNGQIIDFKTSTTCIATGGIGSSEDMMDEYTYLDRGKWRYLGNMGQDGDGIKLVEATDHGRCKHVCAQNMWLTVEGAAANSDANFAGGFESTNIWINQDAQRFCDESVSIQFFVCNNIVGNQGKAFSLFDQAHVEYLKEHGTSVPFSGFSPFMTPMPDLQKGLDEAVANDSVLLYRADTVEELAGLIEVDAATLEQTIERWNTDVAAGVDTAFGKDVAYHASITEGPFYAAKLQSAVLATVGGIRVNNQAQVTTPAGKPIEGLYAAGVCCSGFSGEVYGMQAAGTTQGTAAYLGRLAGRAAAERA